MFEQVINVDRMEQTVSLFGSFDENIKLIESQYNVKVISRGSEIKVSGDAENVSRAVRAINGLLMLINRGEALSEQNVRYVLSLVNEGNEDKLTEMTGDCVCITAKGKPIKPKTLGQKRYLECIKNNTITLGAGPAGTGKTYLAVAMAVNAFRAKEINRIILTRPAVEAGEKDKAVELFKIATKAVDKAADKAGLKMMSLGDRIKSKAKEYMAYLSVAEVFMWIEQAARAMFDTVLEIDTAMTGLHRVTDLTASQYDALFNNMISSAKEYGATLNDIINATTDWVRAGFDADTSLGLAEVTTMYQHISDLDYDTAAENLITAYNGFKDELNGLFSGDEVAAVNYIADIFNELDNNFAVTSAGLGEAMTRSASALDLAGNSIQETAGLITGITEVTQDPEKAGSALKVLSLRLRGKRIMPPYKESLYALFELKDDSNIEDNYICQNARVA